jgi:penicillin-binding protein 1B
MKSFSAPQGVQQVRVDKNTWLPADDTCPEDYYVAFLDGTVPNSTCSHMGDENALLPGLLPSGMSNPGTPAEPGEQPAEPAPHKKNFFQRLFGGGNKEQQNTQPEQQQPQR